MLLASLMGLLHFVFFFFETTAAESCILYAASRTPKQKCSAGQSLKDMWPARSRPSRGPDRNWHCGVCVESVDSFGEDCVIPDDGTRIAAGMV